MNKNILRMAVATLMTATMATASAISPDGLAGLRHPAPLAFARKATPQGAITINPGDKNAANGLNRAASVNPDLSFIPSDELGYLSGPQGETWFYTAVYDYEYVQHEYYTENVLKGFTYTVYNAELKEVGKVHDVIRLHEGENSARAISIDPQITSKFFNSDSKYEVVIGLAAGTPDYSVNTYSLVYSLNGTTDQDGNTKQIAEFPGYIVDAIDAAPDAWSEQFYITFYHETSEPMENFSDYMDWLSTYRNVLQTYKYGGYGEPTLVSTIEIPMLNLPGDGMSNPFFFSKKVGNTFHFIAQYYEKSFFVDPTGMSQDESITPDNKLIIDDYTIASPRATEFTLSHRTEIPTVQDPEYVCSFYGIGTMAGVDDADYTIHGTATNPAWFVGVDNYRNLADENYTSMYYLYDNAGNRKQTITEYSMGTVMMSDVKGHSPQVMFIKEAINGYMFEFVNLTDFATTLSIPSTYEGLSLTTALDRRATGNSYEYVCDAINNYEDGEGNLVAIIAHIAADGTVLPNEELILGKQIAYAQTYISAGALSPYVFNTDDKMEYMVLVKRFLNDEGSETREELLILNPGEAEPLLAAIPDGTKGALANILLFPEPGHSRLMIVYKDDDHRYHEDFYNLPLTKFAGGQGTVSDPYLISTVADLQAISYNPKANYAIANDFDAAGFPFIPVADFTGILDGQGHTISNLHLERNSGYVGIFVNAMGATVKNLTFLNPSVTLGSNNSNSGLIAGFINGTYPAGGSSPEGAKIDDIHAYGLKVDGNGFTGTFGGLAGRSSLGTQITRCYINDADINLPQASAGGLVGDLLTSATVKASAFRGTIVAGTAIGGIASTAGRGCVMEDNHVSGILEGQYNLGGIVAESSRAIVNRNIFQGQIQALGSNKWNRNIGMGGIVGYLYGPTMEDTDPDALCVTNNIVSMNWSRAPQHTQPEEWEGQHATVHRIVGWTRNNASFDPDENETRMEAEKCLAYNYAIDHFAVCDPAVSAHHTSTEGESLPQASLNDVFVKGLGFSHGTTAENPWNITAYIPNLHFENSIVIETPEVRGADLNATFMVPVTVTSRVPLTEAQLLDDLTVDMDETHCEMTGNYTYDGHTLSLELKPLRQAMSYFSVSTNGSTAKTRILTGAAGVNDIIVDNSGTENDIWYNLNGIRINEPTTPGLYIKANGNKATKVRIN